MSFVSAAVFGYEISGTRKHEVQIVTVTLKPIDVPASAFDTSEMVLYGMVFVLFSLIAVLISVRCKGKSLTVANNSRLNA